MAVVDEMDTDDERPKAKIVDANTFRAFIEGQMKSRDFRGLHPPDVEALLNVAVSFTVHPKWYPHGTTGIELPKGVTERELTTDPGVFDDIVDFIVPLAKAMRKKVLRRKGSSGPTRRERLR